ncbi:thiol-disulfide isomerase/thioredoxin [Rhodoligotrophos appendicifer]|uniref:TlpA disulfide reductase family protein n=1 Tax=Rhodoligotrophos appendicifer TaxID=987056 RepID=UPI00118536AA|nr:TlpA disulfide reductase family protein [Rhodoligotrophos appendicifer]
MSDTTSGRRGSRLMVVLGLVVLVALAAALYLIITEPRNVQNAGTAAGSAVIPAGLAHGDMAAFLIHKTPRELPPLSFTDAEGKPLSMADWQGKTVLLNLWATWCAPCREEMPALAALQKKYGGENFEVVAISIDQKGAPVAKAFLDEIGVKDLAIYLDKTTKTLGLLKGVGLPTTVLIDPQGQELGRLLGPAVWDSPDAIALIEAALARDAKGS